MKQKTRTRLCQINNSIVRDCFTKQIILNQDEENFFTDTIEKLVYAYNELM